MNIENIIQIIVSEPIYLSIVSLLILVILYTILKKLFKALIVSLALTFIYIGYLIYIGEELPGSIDVNPIKESIESSYNEAKNKLDQFIEDKDNEK